MTTRWSVLLILATALAVAGAVTFHDELTSVTKPADSADRTLNISWFVYRDANRNGVYDTADRPYAGQPVALVHPDGETRLTTSNINGFANFSMGWRRRDADMAEAGAYSLHAYVGEAWQVTTSSERVLLELRRLRGSPAGLVANSTPPPLGLAPTATIRGTLDKNEQFDKLLATDPSGETRPLNPRSDGSFRIDGEPGRWMITAHGAQGSSIVRRSIEVDYYPVVVSRSYLNPESDQDRSSEGMREITVTYDDLASADSLYKIPNGYRGLNWHNWIATHQYFYNGHGYVNATVSPEYIAYTGSGHPGRITSDTSFDFLGTYLGVAWRPAGDGVVHIEGFRGSERLYHDTVTVTSTLPVYFLAGYQGITRLDIHSDIYWQVILEDSRFRVVDGSPPSR